MAMSITRRSFVSALGGTAALVGTACASSSADGTSTDSEASSVSASERVNGIVAAMSLEQKIAQMIMPAIRTWEGEGNGVTDLSALPDLASALQKHQYGGVILFGSNVVDTEQTLRLVSDLQTNNAKGVDASTTTTIPYFVAADQEGGSVARLSMGTRGTGSMAIGATGDAAAQNARDTGTIFGLELSALGINLNLAPCVDIITDLADAGMSTRVFSDDPQVVTDCALGFSYGLDKSRVVTCYKHFPGAGDGSDDPTAVSLTLEQLQQGGLIPYAAVIENGAAMIMVSACTFPNIDDEITLADGMTKGYYPATISPKIVGKMLREELGFEGVVMTDALEMDQFFDEPRTGDAILPGGRTLEGYVNVAEKCIAAGCDILLLPADLNGKDKVTWYEDYIAGIAKKVTSGTIDEGLIDDSVRRILNLKEACDVLDLDVSGQGVEEAIAKAKECVGSAEHHDIERAIAEKAVTLLKDDGALPVPGKGASVVILGRTESDATPIGYALSELMGRGDIDPNARVENAITGKVTGSENADANIYVDRYYDLGKAELVWADGLSDAIARAQYVVCLSTTWAGLDALQDTDARVQGVSRALKEAHEAGAKFVLLSDNLPVDAARFLDADAIVCCYLSSGFDVDPTGESDSGSMCAINANVPAALRAIFGAADMPGTLPIAINAMKKDESGAWAYTDEVLFARGTSAS
ncbi:MAG: hypothetical protein IKG18_05665 [Atopobiaceae bacterium]|nr:hypothetical protein [Atopobiaceae bacterium]